MTVSLWKLEGNSHENNLVPTLLLNRKENELSTRFIDKLVFLTMGKMIFLASNYFLISNYQYGL